ncbi:MAG: uroporphyrinogen-III C-methyltransferase [Ketobacteraceae bacterium]|nr:uroporphyrinogen-III C-methyltransferase [Ketobacteraceae bacterium]
MSDTEGLEKPVSGGKTTLSGRASGGARGSRPKSTENDSRPGSSEVEGTGRQAKVTTDTENPDYQASFHPDTETRFATLSQGNGDKGNSMEKTQAGKPQKEKALSKQSSSSFPTVLAVIALFIALAAAAGIGYLWNESRVDNARLAYEKSSLQADIKAQDARLEALQATITALGKELQDTENFAATVKANNQTLDGRVAAIESEIAEMTGSSRIDWMLREVEHFVMVAERRLSLLGDVDGALALMIEADQLVREMAEPAARPLRNAIQSDLMLLQQASDVSVDTEGLFARLSLLSEKVPALRAASINYEMSLESKKQTETVPGDGLAYAWYEVKRFLTSLVRVQRVTDGEIKPLLLQDQQIFVEQNIRLLLEQAQLALLRGDQVIYETSLGEVESRIREYLRTNTKEAESFLKSIAQLKAAVVNPPVPSIESSVRAVQVFRDYWQKEKVERQLGTAAIENAVDSAQSSEAAGKEVSDATGNAAGAPADKQGAP